MTSPSVTGTDPSPASLSASIRSATRAHHERAEHADFQKRLVAGKHGPAAYGAWLGQMLLLHEALEALEESGTHRAGVTGWPVERDHFRAGHLRADLAAVGTDAAGLTPLPATSAFIERCRAWASRPGEAWRLLGVWYVLEGATNGGRFIARNVRRGAGLAGPGGTRYLDPYGEAQPQRWEAFKQSLDAVVPEREWPKVHAAACETYDAVTAIGDQLAALFPAPAR